MSSEEINKYLTEAMGECWHENTDIQSAHTICRDCPIGYLTHYWIDYRNKHRNNFFTWEGFGKLWEWATKQEWWVGFIRKATYLDNTQEEIDADVFHFKKGIQSIINPTNFAKAIYDYLKEQE